MARRPRPARREPRFSFQFHGWDKGWYTLSANIGRPHSAGAVHTFSNEVLDWLHEQEITPNVWSYLAVGNTGDGPVVPESETGPLLGLLFRRPTDLMRFRLAGRELGFRLRITPEALFEAVHREASVHKFVLVDMARIAHAAMAEHASVFGEDGMEWDDLEDDARQLLIQTVREYAEHPEWTAERQHEAWVDTRRLEDWQYGATIDYRRRRHPLMVPFARLPSQEQMRRRLITGVVAQLAPLL